MSSRTETLRPLPRAGGLGRGPAPAPADGTWWGRYFRALSGFSAEARATIEADARYIASAANPPFVEGDETPGAVRTGIVVGSVQSGKTASMLGAAAMLLDGGVDLLIVLAGTRVALWLQTYERLLQQLDGSTMENAWRRNGERLIVPLPNDILGDQRADPRRYLLSQRRRVRMAAVAQTPVIFVVPKEDDHLLELGRFLSDCFSGATLDAREKPLRMVVLDDEADDASILEAGADQRVTPSYIQQLWADRRHPGETRHPRLHATYIAYTATPMANFLQASHNPLSPRHFQVALRTPSDGGAVSPRSLTYTERGGIRRYYTGGSMFYERLRGGAADPCVSRPFPVPTPDEPAESFDRRFRGVRWEMLGDALRGYFVAGALRLAMTGRRLADVECLVPMSPGELGRILPPTHSMLYHPSALRELHFQGADDIARWSGSEPDAEEDTLVPRDALGGAVLDAAGLARRLAAEEDRWRAWVGRFDASVAGLSAFPGAAYRRASSVSWHELRSILINDVFPFTKLRVLNSDPKADDRPCFGMRAVAGGALPPDDVFTIFVAGNVLSRGLTVEGLATSLFLRSAREPAADTQMQMQRWFGYRGEHLPFCRVHLFHDQLELFRAYHVNDEAMKQEILVGMEAGSSPARRGVLVLQGRNFRATAKVLSHRVPLHPGPTPTVRLLEIDDPVVASGNASVLGGLLGDGEWRHLEVAGTARGRVRTEPLSLVEVAATLEALRFSRHDPDPTHEFGARWISVQRALRLQTPLFRPPGVARTDWAVDPSGCPYSIAAYLRLWAAALDTHAAPGLYPTDAPRIPWGMIDLDAYRRARPRFYVAVRYGGEGPATDPRLAAFGVLAMRRGVSPSAAYLLETLWGSRGRTGEYLGDQLLDYHVHGSQPVPRLHQESVWRPRGHPGLVLFHVVRSPSEGEPDSVAVGLSLPHGGPDHIAALREGTGDDS